ncbi:MAG: S8 family serine peptidase [Planctomycetes bacterium]|nr:S8 family serine peptidase [Planctomycetota bacterium]
MDESRTVFDDLFKLLTPDRLLLDPRATGEGVRIGLIDSGVERSVIENRFREEGLDPPVIDGAIFRNDSLEPRPYEGKQSSPHGTTVADIILRIAPKAHLFSADVFGPAGTSEVETVIRSLRYAIDVWKCKIINLSLGVPEHRLQPVQKRIQFQKAIEDAYYKDVLIFAAAHNEHPITRSFPAAFAPPLISVDKALFADPLQFAYLLRETVEFQAHSRGYLGPFSQEPATSWATPHLAGIAARLLSLKPDLKPFEIKTILYWMFQAGKGAEDRSPLK